MDTITLPEKAVGETIPLVVNFGDRLQYGESINGCTVAITVLSGTDANPSAMLSGSPSFTSNTVTQAVTAGVVGVTYMVVFVVTASGSHNYIKEGRLVVTQQGVQ
jgi:hypothetical protein